MFIFLVNIFFKLLKQSKDFFEPGINSGVGLPQFLVSSDARINQRFHCADQTDRDVVPLIRLEFLQRVDRLVQLLLHLTLASVVLITGSAMPARGPNATAHSGAPTSNDELSGQYG